MNPDDLVIGRWYCDTTGRRLQYLGPDNSRDGHVRVQGATTYRSEHALPATHLKHTWADELRRRAAVKAAHDRRMSLIARLQLAGRAAGLPGLTARVYHDRAGDQHTSLDLGDEQLLVLTELLEDQALRASRTSALTELV